MCAVKMNKREQFIDYVKNGGAPICSPQIGAGAGFDTKLAGKRWIGETTLEDTIAACERFDMVPLLNAGVADAGYVQPKLAWKSVGREQEADKITSRHELVLPSGTLQQEVVEEPIRGGVRVKSPITQIDELHLLDEYLDLSLREDFSPMVDLVKATVKQIDGRGASSFQWAVQPYELLCFPDTVNTVIFAMENPEMHYRLMDKILQYDEKLFDVVAEGGGDFIFLGGPGSEMISPRFYREFLIPYSQKATQMAHDRGLLVYSHICSPIEPFLSMGFYNQMGIDLFETLSPPPVGNVSSLTDAFSKLDDTICTRGNVGLDLLLNGTDSQVYDKCVEIISESKGRKHMVAASDYLFYDVPIENVYAMCLAVSNQSNR